MINKVKSFKDKMERRRTTRDFSNAGIPKAIITEIIMTASSAPSGANKQPWFFCAVSDSGLKREIRLEAEKIEQQAYTHKMSEEWKKDLKHLGTNWEKEFLENAPWLIVVFKKTHELVGEKKKKNYYVNESVGLATGFLITAIHNVGLSCLTYTPSPMGFLNGILNRPDNEKPYMVIPIGYAANNAFLPELTKKDQNEVLKFYF